MKQSKLVSRELQTKLPSSVNRGPRSVTVLVIEYVEIFSS